MNILYYESQNCFDSLFKAATSQEGFEIFKKAELLEKKCPYICMIPFKVNALLMNNIFCIIKKYNSVLTNLLYLNCI